MPDILKDHTHFCLNGKSSNAPAWWARDAQRIPLCKVCDRCERSKLAGYRPEILHGYTQADVDEPIEPAD